MHSCNQEGETLIYGITFALIYVGLNPFLFRKAIDNLAVLGSVWWAMEMILDQKVVSLATDIEIGFKLRKV